MPCVRHCTRISLRPIWVATEAQSKSGTGSPSTFQTPRNKSKVLLEVVLSCEVELATLRNASSGLVHVLLYLRLNVLATMTPMMNPPTCAHTATPPFIVVPNELIALRNCIAHHIPSTTTAGTGIKKIKNRDRMRFLGSSTM